MANICTALNNNAQCLVFIFKILFIGLKSKNLNIALLIGYFCKLLPLSANYSRYTADNNITDPLIAVKNYSIDKQLLID